MICTAPFEANPDVSGIGILIAFYGQAILNLVLSTWSDLHRRTNSNYDKVLHKRVHDLKLDLTTDWVNMGLAMTIAALTQWKIISMFHLFLCVSFAITIPTENLTLNGIKDWKRDRQRTIYFTAFKILRIVLLSYFIYRFTRVWGNTPGQCFRIGLSTGPIGGYSIDSSNDQGRLLVVLVASRILLDAVVGIIALVYISNAWFQRCIDAWAQKETDWVRGGIFLLIKITTGGAMLLVNSILGIGIVLANQTQIVGTENSFNFGQVTALVTLVASLYKIGVSLYTYWYHQKYPKAEEESVKDLGDHITPMLPVSSVRPPMSSDPSKESNP